MARLIDLYDAALFDLDGVIYLGPHAIDGVIETIDALHRDGVRVGFVTNNAARTPTVVASHLRDLGITADTHDVVNSTQATIRLMQADLDPGTCVLVVGTDGLREQVVEGGFTPVAGLEDSPEAVIQGYHPHLPWELLEHGAIAVQNGARWYATNPDLTRPTERGILPGCGAQVALIRACADHDPIMAGKPFRPLLDETVRRLQAENPIFVGDRLDTDIMGAQAVGMDSLFVFTGAHGIGDLVAAQPHARPTYIGYDVRALLQPARVAVRHASTMRCGGQTVHVNGSGAHLDGSPHGRSERLDALWAALRLAWDDEIRIDDVLSRLGDL
ncbi:MAG: HAD-IIA family hydrolase [Arachnia sp.]